MVLFLHFWPQSRFPLLLKTERFQSDCCKTIYAKWCKITMKQTLPLFVQCHLHQDWNLENSQKRRVAETDLYTFMEDNMFFLARKLEHFYKAQQPSLNANNISLFGETQHSWFASSLLSCVHAPSWMSLCCKRQWSIFHFALSGKDQDSWWLLCSSLTSHPAPSTGTSSVSWAFPQYKGIMSNPKSRKGRMSSGPYFS